MTQEEKAKRYDEAIERVENIKTGKCETTFMFTAGLLEHIFPELKDSEDERIRKALIKIVNGIYQDEVDYAFVEDGISYEQLFNWLEKQGEQKGLDYPYVTGWRKNYKDNKPKVKHSVLMFTTHGIAEGEWLGEEWCQYRWSCKIKDEDVLYWLHLSDLENLEKENVEQKPAWSEKNEAVLDALIRRLEGEDIYVSPHLAVECLKSLKERYTWKPSDEQIEALEHFVRSVGESGYTSPYDNNTKLLYSLLEQLKRLKG